jgi:hypothetical protein
VTGWLRRGAAAVRIAGERGELWPAGALGWLVYLGWLPLFLVVAPPSGDDVAYFGVSLVTSGSYPANVIALAVAATASFVLLCLLAAGSEMALTAALLRQRRGGGSAAALAALAVILVASVPAFLGGALVVLGIVDKAAAVYTSPDVDTPALLRLAAAVLPQLVALALGVLLGQVIGGPALRAAIRSGAQGPGHALREGAGRLVHRPAGVVGVAAIGWLKDLLLVAGMYALLRVLWQPTAAALQRGLLSSPLTLLLLVGFVAIWLLLVVAAGAFHAAVSAWWLAELEAPAGRA